MRMNGGSSRECHVSRVVWRVTPVHCALQCALIELSAALPAAWCGQLVRLWSCSHAACLIIGNILIISLCLCLILASNNVNYSSHIHKYLYKYPQCTENGLTPPVLTILGSVCADCEVMDGGGGVARWSAPHNPPPAYNPVRIHVV